MGKIKVKGTINKNGKVVFKCHCSTCGNALIYTDFGNGIKRYLCPICHRKTFVECKDGGLVEAKCYSDRVS